MLKSAPSWERRPWRGVAGIGSQAEKSALDSTAAGLVDFAYEARPSSLGGREKLELKSMWCWNVEF